MGKHVALTAADAHKLGCYRADPQGKPKGGLVVVQEIFGVNHHIRAVCDQIAAEGYVAVAPAVFDRFQRDFDSGYSPDEIAHARGLIGNLNWDHLIADLTAARDEMKSVGPVGVIGFCMGGSASFLASCRIPGLAAAVCYYGGAINKFMTEKPKCPVQMHFGEKDESIPLTTVEEIKKNQPQAEVYIYPGAPHAFSNNDRPNFRKEATDLAWSRTKEFLGKNMK